MEVAHDVTRKSEANSNFITVLDGQCRRVESVRIDDLELAGSWIRKRNVVAVALADRGRDAP